MDVNHSYASGYQGEDKAMVSPMFRGYQTHAQLKIFNIIDPYTQTISTSFFLLFIFLYIIIIFQTFRLHVNIFLDRATELLKVHI